MLSSRGKPETNDFSAHYFGRVRLQRLEKALAGIGLIARVA